MKTELSKTAQRDLEAIAHSINDREQTIETLRRQTNEAANNAVTEAILQGQELIRAKAMVLSGFWIDWLKAKCPLVKVRMAQNYMKLAINAAKCRDANSLRTALLLCSGDDDEPQRQKAKRCPEDLQLLLLYTRAAKFAKAHDITTLPEETKSELRSELYPTAKALWPDVFATG